MMKCRSVDSTTGYYTTLLVAVHLFSVTVSLVNEAADSPWFCWHIHVTVPRRRLSDSKVVVRITRNKAGIFTPLGAKGSFLKMIPRVPLLAQALIVEMEKVRILTQRHPVLELCTFAIYLTVELDLCLLWGMSKRVGSYCQLRGHDS